MRRSRPFFKSTLDLVDMLWGDCLLSVVNRQSAHSTSIIGATSQRTPLTSTSREHKDTYVKNEIEQILDKDYTGRTGEQLRHLLYKRSHKRAAWRHLQLPQEYLSNCGRKM